MVPKLVLLALAALTPSSFNHLFEEIQPPEDATWRSIPWKTSLLDAQAEAARDGKPLFIWAMDGHPLGCT
ncbi:MAG: hypothetical protein AAGC68_01970 [Verrucomicrobiota bacterium]